MSAAAPSAHARYRSRLHALGVHADVVRPALAAARWLPDGCEQSEWRRLYARFHPDRAPFAMLVLGRSGGGRQIVRMDAFEERPAPRSAREVVVETGAGWLRVGAFPSDPALRSLAALLARDQAHTVVRYRPYRRCTVRFDGDGVRYAKVFADRRAERIHAGGVDLWTAAERGELAFAVPRPDRYERRTRTVWQSSVSGQPARFGLSRPGGMDLARRMGLALASLGAARLSPSAVLPAPSLVPRTARLAAELVRRVPELEPDVGRLLGWLHRELAKARRRPLGPVHGSPHPGHWLYEGLGVGLVDFDGMALGHPELDAASFLAGLEFENRPLLPAERLGAAFLAGYEAGGRSLDPQLMSTYRTYRRLAKALRVACSLRPDGDWRAKRHVGRALAKLGEEAA